MESYPFNVTHCYPLTVATGLQKVSLPLALYNLALWNSLHSQILPQLYSNRPKMTKMQLDSPLAQLATNVSEHVKTCQNSFNGRCFPAPSAKLLETSRSKQTRQTTHSGRNWTLRFCCLTKLPLPGTWHDKTMSRFECILENFWSYWTSWRFRVAFGTWAHLVIRTLWHRPRLRTN